MQKLKTLLPTLRERKRYAVYEIISKNPVAKDISKEIIESIKETLGIFDSAKAGMLGVEYDISKQKGILRISHTSVDKLRSAMILITKLNKEDAIIRVMSVSGTLKNARKRMI